MSRCRCTAAEFTGCACAIADGQDINVSGSGSGPDPFLLGVNLDPSVGNNILRTTAGLIASGPRGVLASSGFVITSQPAINPGSPIAGLSVSFNFKLGRRYRVIWESAGMISTNPDESWSFQIREGMSAVQNRYVQAGGVASSLMGGGSTIYHIPSAAAGSRTFYAFLQRASGSGTGTHVADSGSASVIYVEDVTAQ